ncbi:hypothetical protein PAECIP111894_04979 [Paenibacillus pseudetheri]|uniref:Uncharacterized protein n=1 Tax=Paenibacillus pseudetheri TaxID=2897682 RepID=A0ABN8FL65_9BACL|nr:hypothetical protein PAECIP111894_04979 [Paenibacillus pseudetheri]
MNRKVLIWLGIVTAALLILFFIGLNYMFYYSGK